MTRRGEVKTHLDLFSGIGGFALAARWAGFETIGFCEIDKYAQKVLKKNFPGVPIYEDVTKLNGDQFKDIYLLTGGFPCQDISIAGKGAGLDGERSGLWTELHRIISEVRPKYALIENVPALTFRGGTRVIGDLTEIGYDTEWQIVGADDVGAPHRRKRIWIVAYPKHSADRTNGGQEGEEESIQGINRQEGCSGLPGGTGSDSRDVAYSKSERGECWEPRVKGINTQCGEGISGWSSTRDVAYPQSKGSRRAGKSRISESEQSGVDNHKEGNRSEIWGNSTGCGEQDAEDVAHSNSKRGCLRETNREDAEDVRESSRREEHRQWLPEPSVGRVVNGLPHRVDRLKGLGNAIVPQVAYEIMRCLK